MKKLAIVLATLALIAGFGLIQAEAAPTDTIAVTVTLSNISVSVTPDTWAIGTIAPGAIVVQSPDTATNDGNVTENLSIAVSNSTDWTAGVAAGVNVFAMDVGPAGGPYDTNVTTGGLTLTSGLAALASYDFGLEFNAPTAGSVYTGQSITVTITATAA
jgi:hypothetical protein